MKKSFPILSAISFILYALVDFAKNSLETYCHVLLKIGIGNFSSEDYFVDACMCQTILLAVGVVCIVAFIASFFVKEKK